MKTKTFLILRVVQVPTGVKQVALQKRIALLKTLDLSFLAARFFFHLFGIPFSTGTVVLKNLGLHSVLFVSLGVYSLEVAGRVLAVSSLLALLGFPCVLVLHLLVRENTLPAKLFLLEASSLLALVTMLSCLIVLHMLSATSFLLEISSLLVLVMLLDCGSLLRLLMQWSEDIFDGCAGRHGEEQRAPGGWRAPRPLPGALRQVRSLHRCVSENLTSLSSSLVPHARFSLHPSFVSQNSSLSHGSGAMNSCGSMHGLCMHDNY